MIKYLINTCETYRVESETEAKQLIENAKNDGSFTLLKYTSEYKERKSKGEVIDSFYKITLTKVFNDIKEPEYFVDVKYHTEPAFPEPIVNNAEYDEDEEDKNGGIEF